MLMSLSIWIRPIEDKAFRFRRHSSMAASKIIIFFFCKDKPNNLISKEVETFLQLIVYRGKETRLQPAL